METRMTTRKLNMIRKATYLDGFTFESILKYVEGVINVDNYTAKQIAEIMDICKAQSEYGYDKCARENSLY